MLDSFWTHVSKYTLACLCMTTGAVSFVTSSCLSCLKLSPVLDLHSGTCPRGSHSLCPRMLS